MNPTQHPPTDVHVTPADILRGAALYLQRHGWHREALYADSGATTSTPSLTPAACALGAIGMAAFGQRIPKQRDDQQCQGWRDFSRACDFFSDHLNQTGAKRAPTRDEEDWEGPSVGDWNDEPGRTPIEVHAALADAANEWDRIHRPLPVLNLPGGENA